MKIATLNFNGEVWSQINRLRISVEMKKSVKKNISKKLLKGLCDLLENKDIDIIACQEIIAVNEEFEKIKNKVDEKGYYIYPKAKNSNTLHFMSVFIIKKELQVEEVPKLQFSKECRYSDIKIKGIILINMHIPLEENRNEVLGILKKLKHEEKIILLGDFNSYSDNQVDDIRNSSNTADFIKNIEYINEKEQSYFECGLDNDYTYFISNSWRKLDHILISKELAEEYDLKKICEKVTWVNYSENEEIGFTDHSMLVINLD